MAKRGNGGKYDASTSNVDLPRGGERYGRRVVVKFQDHVALPYDERAEKMVEELHIGPWSRTTREYPGLRLVPLFHEPAPAAITRLSERATELDDEYRAPNLLTYYAVECPPDVDPHAVAKTLATWPAVQTAYVEGGPTPPPAVNAADDPRAINQGYLQPAPDGIDARYAWTVAGGDGTGIQLVDMEQGWTLNHEDLTAAGITIISGVSQAYFGHGTSVLGEVAAVDNTIGDVGICTKASVRVVSQYRTAAVYNTAEAVLSAVAALGFGDVLLLEAQTTVNGIVGFLPVEVEAAVYDTIRLGTALGVVIVEAAGNGSNDLDTISIGGVQVLNRASAGFRDSGAIMVGAASSSTPHTRLGFSNYGSRIDCFGWGQAIDTTGDGWTGNLTSSYTGSFGGTSGASPIVAGAAVDVQGVAQARLGYRFSPRQLRAMLSDPTINTPSGTPATDRIGVMPNLRVVIDTSINAAPDIYLRDFVGDVGDPHSGAVSASPDVILATAQVADPQAAFGEGSGTENSNMLGAEAESGQDNFVYVRMRNRGGSPATNVLATVYWSPVATLVTPDLWTLLGTTTLPSVPVGDLLTVAGPITWPAAQIPATGHYCFVGLIGNAADPAPGPSAFTNWNNFLSFIRENNNVTWRNFNVVNNVPPAGANPPGFVPLEFLATGAPDLARRMRLEIVGRLPEGAKLLLEAPRHLMGHAEARTQFTHTDPRRGIAVLPVNPHGRTLLGEAQFPAESRASCRLLAQIPEKLREREFEVHVRQLYRGHEVGRVTWRLSPKAKRHGERG